jgi:chemotaxis protein MotC
LLVLVLSGSSNALAETADPASKSGEPYELVRSLQTVQDGIATGSARAHDGHLALLKLLGERIAAANPSVWSNPKNGYAVVIFLLSGGAPQIVQKLPRDRLNVDQNLLNGALAYVEGRQDDAQKLLNGFRARALPSGLGGHLALVQAALLAGSEPVAAIERLDEARLLMPGTLVEEAALRREIFLVGQAEDFDKFEFLTRAYIRHYRNSIYAGDFWQRFALALTRFDLGMNERRFARISTMTGQLDEADQLKLYLLISRTALVRGRMAMAGLSAARALGLSADGSPERERAHFLHASARVLTDNYDEGLAELKAVDKSKLSERDVPLFNAALELALNVRKPRTPLKLEQAEPGAGDPPPTPARIDLGSSTAALAQARKHLSDLDRLLKEHRE